MNEQFLDNQIKRSLQAGLTQRKIAKILCVGRDRIRAVSQSMLTGQNLTHNRNGPLKVTPVIRARIVQLTLQDARLSDSDVAEIITKEFKIKLSRCTVNTIRHSEKFNFKPLKHCQLLTESQMQERLQFVKSYRDKELPTENLLFSDESRFILESDKRWVWRRKGEYPESVFRYSKKYPSGIMIWGAIGV